MPAVNRSATREAVVQAAFAVEFRDAPERRSLFLEECFALAKDEVHTLDKEFGKKLFVLSFDKIDDIHAKIAEFAPDWPYEKISRLDRAILVVSIAELSCLEDEDIPAAVTLNEYVEIAKCMGGDSSRRFVNGVLSSIKKAQEGEKTENSSQTTEE